MKKLVLILLTGLVVFSVSCKKDDSEAKKMTEVSLDATSHSDWHYFSFSKNKVIGTEVDNDILNNAWFSRNDWDIAIRRYEVRTNSGEATSINSQGGVYTFGEGVSYESIKTLPENVEFVLDEVVTENTMNGILKTIKSKATVIQFKRNDDGSMIMPPIYLPSPVYAFRSADGKNIYKLNFTQYKNELGTSGNVKFEFATIAK